MDTFFFDLVREPEKVMVATIIIVFIAELQSLFSV